MKWRFIPWNSFVYNYISIPICKIERIFQKKFSLHLLIFVWVTHSASSDTGHVKLVRMRPCYVSLYTVLSNEHWGRQRMKLGSSTPLSTATPRSSLALLVCSWFLTLTEDAFLLLCCFSLWSLACGRHADCLVSKMASEAPRNWVISAGREKSVRKGMGWALATSLRSFRRCWYRVDRLTRIPRQITLMEHKGRSV